MTDWLWLVDIPAGVGGGVIGWRMGDAVRRWRRHRKPRTVSEIESKLQALEVRAGLRPAAHRPDYAKIRRLELELGLRDPDPVPDREPVVRVTRVDQIRYADPPSFETGLPPSRFDPRSRGQHYELEVPPAVTSPSEWAYCPVCTRRHAGRCAG